MQALDERRLNLAVGVRKLSDQSNTVRGYQNTGYCELGGIVLMDMGTGKMHHESPMDLWDKSSRAMTRNAI